MKHVGLYVYKFITNLIKYKELNSTQSPPPPPPHHLKKKNMMDVGMLWNWLANNVLYASSIYFNRRNKYKRYIKYLLVLGWNASCF
jgi:hypothetical protein